MNRVTRVLNGLKAKGEKALLPYITIGDPDLFGTKQLMRTLAESGADIIELGIPFSDPLADGPILQEAAVRALQNKIDLEDVCTLLAEFRENYDTPVVLLVYFNLIYHAGLEHFCRRVKAAGADALVVPDLPFEEKNELDDAAQASGLLNIRFLAPTTDDKRIIDICKDAAGFIYCVSVTGVTGVRNELDPAVAALIKKARAVTNVPVALGFGISGPKQAADAARVADAVIVGSALVRQVAQTKELERKCQEAAVFVSALKKAIVKGTSRQ